MQAKILKAEPLGQALKLNILVNDSPAVLEKLQGLSGKPITLEIKQLREKRSLDSNAYFWVICTKIAEVMRCDKETVYRQMLQRYGQAETLTARADVNIENFGIKYYELLKEGEANGKMFKSYLVYIGSSNYDSKQMNRLIDGAVSEAKELGIETLTPEEIAQLEVLK